MARRRRRQALPDRSLNQTGDASPADTLAEDKRPAHPPEPRLDHVDHENYQLEGELARGGLGRIVRARDRRLDRPVAVKELLHDTPEDQARFLREVRITARLQHPSIVPVYEAGRWPSGEPFYAMKLVTGKPLSEIIGETPEFDERLALLPHVIAVAEAMAYAHSEHVIHRDLKPANILVGSFGETVVIDWGLAKDLREAQVLAGSAARDGIDSDQTVAGTVLGTPAYMPVEQARAEPCDERADVYALGATLYQVLSGKVPYNGKSSIEVLSNVIAGPPPPLASRGVPVPPDLVAVVDKAMARDAADRYPSAKELAEDLKRFATGQLVRAHDYSPGALVRRFMRRHLATVIVAASLLAVLAAGTVAAMSRIVADSERARHEREIAVRQREAAERVIHFVVVDMRERLEPLGKLVLLRGMADEVASYYDSVTRDVASVDPDAELRRSTALEVLGDVRFADGNLAGSVEEYRAALAIRARLLGADPQRGARVLAVAETENAIGRALDWTGDYDAALPWLEWSQALVAPLCPREPRETECARLLAAVDKNLGDNLSARDYEDESMEVFRAAAAIDEALVARDPANLLWQHELARSRDWLARTLLFTRRTDEALAIAQQNLDGLLVLVRDHPSDLLLASDLAWTYARVGRAHNNEGRGPQAAAAFRAGLEVAEMLSRSDPENLTWLRLEAALDDDVAIQLFDAGDVAGSVASESKAAAILERLVAADPQNTPWRYDLADSRDWLGARRRVAGDLGGALADYRAAEAVADVGRQRTPRELGLQYMAMKIRGDLGEGLLDIGEWQASRAAYTEALAIEARFAGVDHDVVRWVLRAVDAHEGLGDLAVALGDHALAVREYQAALEQGGAGFQLPRRSPLGLTSVLGILAARARSLVVLGRLDEALADLARGRGYCAETSFKDADGIAPFLAQAAAVEADLHAARGEVGAARAGHEDAARRARALLAAAPADAELVQAAADELVRLGDARLADGHRAAALAAYREGLALAARGVAAAAEVVSRQEALARAHARLGRALTGSAGERDKAEAQRELDQALAVARSLPAEKRSAALAAIVADCEAQR